MYTCNTIQPGACILIQFLNNTHRIVSEIKSGHYNLKSKEVCIWKIRTCIIAFPFYILFIARCKVKNFWQLAALFTANASRDVPIIAWPYCSSRSQTLASCAVLAYFVPDSWRTKWHWSRSLTEVTRFALAEWLPLVSHHRLLKR